jgi:uncharacterized protein (TIGR03435 family)
MIPGTARLAVGLTILIAGTLVLYAEAPASQSGSLLGMLSSSVGRPVVDDTGLTGLYDIDLRFSPEMDPVLADVGGLRVSRPSPN